MKKVGIVTLHNFNYGSALQAFALQKFLEDNYGVQCEFLNKKRGSRISEYLRLLGFCLVHFSSIKSILHRIKISRAKNLTLSSRSLKLINIFNVVDLKNVFCNKKTLKKIGANNEWLFFISGSDQIWNGDSVDNAFLPFLRFAPSTKRISYAPSFGSERIANYNYKRYRNYINEYRWLSIREESGKNIINNFGIKDVEIMPDPVFLLSNDNWKAIYSSKSAISVSGKYVLVFFIDKLSPESIEYLNAMGKDSHFVLFGYKHPELDGIIEYDFLDGNPFDFLFLVDNSSLVLTDSFHCVSFSIIFHKQFYVFDRQYQTKQNQSTRITNILNANNLLDRYNPVKRTNQSCIFDNSFTSKCLATGRTFFDDVFKQFEHVSLNKNVELIRDTSCFRCRACETICNVDAISFVKGADGHEYPAVCYDRCKNCSLCFLRCPVNNPLPKINFSKKAFCGYSKSTNEIKLSSSGGAFYQIASDFIESNGVVCGARLTIDKGIVNCKHILISEKKDISLIQGSKYVQSDIKDVLNEIKDLLKNGVRVLFSGTSCQVGALKSFLGKDYDNLFTIDLICHGIIELSVLQDYVDYLNKKNGYSIISISFRKLINDGKEPYQIRVSALKNNTLVFQNIDFRKSAYLRMFLASGGLRESCYHCPYAPSNKSGDITLGDYLDKDDYYKTILGENKKGIKLSSVIVNSPKGLSILKMDNFNLLETPFDYMHSIHTQLNEPTRKNKYGSKLFNIYLKKGFAAAQSNLNWRNFLLYLPSRIKHLLKHNHE